jgi:hypothetical protein
MKSLAYLIAAAIMISLAGCIWPEEIETRVNYAGKNTPPQITVVWRNISSTAKDEKELKSDFEELVEDLKDSTSNDLIAGIEKELLIKERKIYLQDGKLQAKISAVPGDEKFEDLASNGERLVVVDSEAGRIIATNGRLLETESNYIIVWPESLKEIYWIQRLIPDAPDKDEEDWKRWKQNRPKLVKMFEAYQQKGN